MRIGDGRCWRLRDYELRRYDIIDGMRCDAKTFLTLDANSLTFSIWWVGGYDIPWWAM